MEGVHTLKLCQFVSGLVFGEADGAGLVLIFVGVLAYSEMKAIFEEPQSVSLPLSSSVEFWRACDELSFRAHIFSVSRSIH